MTNDDEELLAEVPLDKRPIVSLTPSGDGHYLALQVDNIVLDADSFDYLLEYRTSNDLLQGVPGIAKLAGNKTFETELLLGTESSGKFRYDEGVETGSVELKFRKNGKLIAKFKTDFKMEETRDGFKVTMNTIGGTSESGDVTFTSEY